MKIDKDAKLIAEAYSKVCNESQSGPELRPGDELVYPEPFKVNDYYDVYYVIEEEREEDNIIYWHKLVDKNGKTVNNIHLTSYGPALSRKDVQKYIDCGMPKSEVIHKANGRTVGGSFTVEELRKYFDTLGVDKQEVSELEGINK